MALSGRSDQKETPKFSVRLISQISSQITGIPTNFRVVYRMTDGRLVAHRVFTMLFVKFANSGTIDGQIDSYTIQGRLRYDFGEWEEINPLYVSPMGFISYAPDPKKSTSMACATPCFDDAVANKIFHPGQETMALLILPMPKGGYATQLRITLVDKGGNQSVYPLESTATAGPASAPADIPVSISMFRVLNKGVDISAIPIESP
jgi:hypothetical protein